MIKYIKSLDSLFEILLLMIIASDFKRISLRANYERNYAQHFKFGVNAN